MLKIRLARLGKKKKPIYRIVVSENTKDMYGNHIEILGSYNPHTKETILKKDQIKDWISKGAKTSNVVNNILIKEGVITGKKKKAVKISKKRRIKLEEVKKEEVAEPIKEEKPEEVKKEEVAEPIKEEKPEE